MARSGLAERVDIRRAKWRAATNLSWPDSKHSFSFGRQYDPANTHHGLLLVNNDDVVRPGAGFETHPHRDMEIVTWVMQGSLVHQDSTGHSGLIYPGLAQRMSAGMSSWRSKTTCRPALWYPSRPEWIGTPVPRRSGSGIGTPHCTPPDCNRARVCSCPMPRTCTCSSPAAG